MHGLSFNIKELFERLKQAFDPFWPSAIATSGVRPQSFWGPPECILSRPWPLSKDQFCFSGARIDLVRFAAASHNTSVQAPPWLLARLSIGVGAVVSGVFSVG